jgi:hypothetical protein
MKVLAETPVYALIIEIGRIRRLTERALILALTENEVGGSVLCQLCFTHIRAVERRSPIAIDGEPRRVPRTG